MARKQPPMLPNGSGVFDDNPRDAHKKVVRALVAKSYPTDRIAKATGLTEAEVKKLIKEMKL